MPARKIFGDFPENCTKYDTAAVVIVPVPYEKTTTYIKGTSKGPQAILQASPNLEFYDIETDYEVFKHGIYTDELLNIKASPHQMVSLVKNRVTEHIKNNKFTVLLGGEHSVSIGSARAHVDSFDNLTVLQLDAHADLRDEYLGSKYNHACTMARIKEFAPILQVGIRAFDSSEKNSLEPQRVFFARDIYNSSSWIERALENLTDNLYITIDLDVFDPSIMPSVGTPEPGGLLWYDVLSFLKAVCRRTNLVGFDVVELCPSPQNIAPDFTAAKLIYKLLTYKFANQK
ncbi:MAG: agmatinase [Planctomycetota bacterium]|jgi:agmatinase